MVGFTLDGPRAVFKPTGPASAERAASLLAEAMGECRRAGAAALLADLRGLTHTPLTSADLFTFGHELALSSDRTIKLALLVRQDQIDPEAFAQKVARNRGLFFERFTDESAAAEWLHLQGGSR